MNDYQIKIKALSDQYAHLVYKITKKFPKEEIYGMTSQCRRAALSVILNYIEGHARKRPLVVLNFLEISYGSLQESRYIINFALSENYVINEECESALKLADEIGAMLWSEIQKIESSVK